MTSSTKATDSERDELVEVARHLEGAAEHGGTEFESRLADFNARTRASCTRASFKLLYQSEEAAELVDRLLEVRDAKPFVPPTTRDELETYLEAASSGSYVAMDHAGDALAHMSRLPHRLAHQLGSGFGTLACWPSRDEIVTFALAYEPATTKEQLLALVRRWLEDEDAGVSSIHVAVGRELMMDRQAALKLPELEPIVNRMRSGVPAQSTHALRQLRKLVGLLP